MMWFGLIQELWLRLNYRLHYWLWDGLYDGLRLRLNHGNWLRFDNGFVWDDYAMPILLVSDFGTLFVASFSLRVFFCNTDFLAFPRMAELNNCEFIDHLGSLALAAEVLLQKAEVVLVGDISIAIHIDHLEDHANVVLLGSELHEGERILDGLCEFRQVHHALAAPVVQFFAMQALDGDFPKVLLHTEVDQLVVLDLPIVIVVVPENVFDEVVHLRAILVQHLLQKVLYFLLLELLIPVLVEFNHLQVNRLSHLERQLVRGELESVLLA